MVYYTDKGNDLVYYTVLYNIQLINIPKVYYTIHKGNKNQYNIPVGILY